MNFFNATKKAAAMLGVAVGVVFAQGVDTAYVPFRVNVDAEIWADLSYRCKGSLGENCYANAQISATANEDVTLALPLPEGTAVLLPGVARRSALPVVSVSGGGKVALNLPATSYKNATVALYGLNGKRVLGAKFSASQAVNSVSRRNVVAGVYLLSIKGADADASVTSRVTHRGGNLEISAAFGGGDLAPVPQMAKNAAYGDWTITVLSTGGVVTLDSVYTLKLTSGVNPKQNISLRVSWVNNCTSAATCKTVTIGTQKWMAENLNITTPSGSWCYDDDPSNCGIFGRMYNWNTAKTVCPTGWHLPTLAEWDTLARFVGGTKRYTTERNYDDWTDAGVKLKSKVGWAWIENLSYRNGTDEYGFSALPGGRRYSDGDVYGGGWIGYWWTATEYDGGTVWVRTMTNEYTSLGGSNHGDKEDSGFSVRCVGD